MNVKDLSMAAWPFWLKRLTVFLTTHPPLTISFFTGLNAACRIQCILCILMPCMRIRAQYGHVARKSV